MLAAPERRAFLEALAITANVVKSAEIANIDRKAAYRQRDADEDFAKAWAEALDLGTDALEDEAVRRAHDGVKEPVFYQGAICGHVQKHSDSLLMFMLKARRPERFKDRVANEVSGPGGVPLAPPNITINMVASKKDERSSD